MLRIFLLFLTTSIYLSVTISQTQFEMSPKSSAVYRDADQKLNEVYQKILDLYSKNALFIKNLEAAQKLWIQYRDAQLAVMYPERFDGYYGSVLVICQGAYLTKLTNARIKELEAWLDIPPKGDVCNSTIGEYEFP
jgi:uncharacterized protein YecT (DUF1311 family)